jgi:hypothetical protein
VALKRRLHSCAAGVVRCHFQFGFGRASQKF